MKTYHQHVPFTMLMIPTVVIVLVLSGLTVMFVLIIPTDSLLLATMELENGGHDILVIDVDHRLTFNLTNYAGDDMLSSWSPDGRQIAFVSQRNFNTDIYLVGVDSRNLRRLTYHEAVDKLPTWSPDGSQIAFISDRNGLTELYLIDVPPNAIDAEPPITRLTFNTFTDSRPLWSPDGNHIAFVSTRGGEDIFAMSPDGTGERRLTNDPSPEFSFAWSPDSTRIAYQSFADNNGEIYVLGVNHTLTDTLADIPRNLTNNLVQDYAPTWSPDGNQIAFTSNRDGDDDIYLLDIATETLTNLTNNQVSDTAPVWSPNGEKIVYYARRNGEWTIYVMNADGSNPRYLAITNTFGYPILWQP